MLKITWELLTDLIFVFQRKIDERCTALNCNVVDSTLAHCNVFNLFALYCIHCSVCTQLFKMKQCKVYIEKEFGPENDKGCWTFVYLLVTFMHLHNCFIPPSLLVEGLLSMGPTLSSFCLLVEMGLPLHLFPAYMLWELDQLSIKKTPT